MKLYFCLLNWQSPSPLVGCLFSVDALGKDEGNRLEMKEVRREVQEIAASSWWHNSEILINIFIEDSGDAIETDRLMKDLKAF